MKRLCFLGLLLRPWNKLDMRSPASEVGQPDSPFYSKLKEILQTVEGGTHKFHYIWGRGGELSLCTV
jgi:hypothetical protein